MHLSIISLLPLALVASTAIGATTTYNTKYDNSAASLRTVSCSDGVHGLITRGNYQTFGSLPNFPFIAGADVIEGWNSVNCGSCWMLTYQGNSVNVLAIDHAGSGFVVSQAAMDMITNGLSSQLKRIDVGSVQISPSQCGLDV